MSLIENLNLHFGFIGVIIAAVVYFFLGGVWYSPKLFGSYHMKQHGLSQGSQEDQTTCCKFSLYAEFVIDLVMAYVLAIFINFAGGKGWADGALIALWVWIGFVATTHLSVLIWTRKTFTSFLISSGFVLIGLVVMGAIIGFVKSL